MLEALASFFSLIVQPAYDLTGSWWAAIFLFTVFSKIVLMPLSLWCQKNSIVMVQLMPELFRIKCRYFGDRETIDEKQNELYKEKHYHALLSLIPLAIQVLILFGLVDVIHSITDSGAPGTEFLGMVPITDGGIAWVMPLAAALSAVIMGWASNHINPLQREQSRAEKNMTNGISIALSLVLAVYVVCGMAFYWVCSNLLSIAVQALCNLIINPHKYIDYEDLAAARSEYESLENATKSPHKWYQPDPEARRSKADYKRFFNTTNKHLVFYSESSGFYKYFQGAIEWLLANSDVRIHYLTSDPNDQVFQIAESEPRLIPYFLDQKRLITLMMKMDADVVVTSLGALDVYYIKRSYVRKDIEYIYMCHHMTSMHLTSTKQEYDNYDTVMCVGPHQKKELRAMEKVYGTKRKELPEIGYDLIDREIAEYESKPPVKNERPTILIAPSWSQDNILDLCIDDMLTQLLGHGYHVIVRPHPEYVKRYRPRWEALLERYANVPESDLTFEGDFSGHSSILNSDILVTDWSSVAEEFSFTTLKPSLFVDTPMKINNPDWEQVGIEPTDISLRNQIGRSVDPHDLSNLVPIVDDMIQNPDRWREQIRQIRQGFIYNLGHGGEAAGKYILQEVLDKQEAKKQAEGASQNQDASESKEAN
jgi:YidC/Oxa1 family membrane protein insertase